MEFVIASIANGSLIFSSGEISVFFTLKLLLTSWHHSFPIFQNCGVGISFCMQRNWYYVIDMSHMTPGFWNDYEKWLRIKCFIGWEIRIVIYMFSYRSTQFFHLWVDLYLYLFISLHHEVDSCPLELGKRLSSSFQQRLLSVFGGI